MGKGIQIGSCLWGSGSEPEALRLRAFQWLTRNGMGRRFPGMPIGWYQQHQCAALEYIEKRYREVCYLDNEEKSPRVYVDHGFVWGEAPGFGTFIGHGGRTYPKCYKLCSTSAVFHTADCEARK